MKSFSQFRKIALALACVALTITTTTASARDIRAHGGDTFALTPSATPGVVIDTVDGVARFSLLGNCTFHAVQAITLPATPDQPYIIKGIWRFSSTDGTTTLDAEVDGKGKPDPANAGFVNIHLKVKFIGGTGRMANAQGKAEIDGVGMFTSPTGGTATWFMEGDVSVRGHRDHDDKDHGNRDRDCDDD